MAKALKIHPVAALFPDMSNADFAALVEDIRAHGLKVPILVHNGQILDGRHRYKACRQLGKPCATVERNGRDPWLEVQSRNLVRRHLTKEQIYAIRILAAHQFPELAEPLEDARTQAKQRKAQARGRPRGTKALSGPQGPNRRSADVIGLQLGVSGTTVKRVDRVARLTPELLPRIAAGELSAKKALQRAVVQNAPGPSGHSEVPEPGRFRVGVAIRRVRAHIEDEWDVCPREYRSEFLRALHAMLREMTYAHTASVGARTVAAS